MDNVLKYMAMAIDEAKIAAKNGDVPVGAVIVKNGVVIGKGYNKKEVNNNPVSHAEIEAIIDACNNIGDWRLNDAQMYVTAEPCIMCAGAIILSRIDKVYFGVKEPKFGAICSQISINNISTLNHQFNADHGYFKEEIEEMMKNFFKTIRNNKK